MMRKKPELCMFCEQIPCECNEPVKKRTPRKAAPKRAEVQATTTGESGGNTFTLPDRRSAARRRRHEKDLALHRAIVALADGGLLAAESRNKYAEIISPPVTGVLVRGDESGGDTKDGNV